MPKNQAYRSRSCMLIIDDDFINREVLKNMFASQFSFAEAENGREGLQVIEAREDDICAILLDVEMPVMDGMELLKILHTRDILSRIPVFLITSNDELETARSAYEMGVMGVINKPVVPFIAMRRVQLVVELFQARDAQKNRIEQQEKQLRENVVTIDTLHRNTLEALASAIEFRDVESGEHTNRIYGITKYLLRHTDMGQDLSAEEIENMAIGSIMHDVGKISISDLILNKPGRLTPAEFETMKTHTVKGAVLLEQLNQMQTHPSYEYAIDIARHHHERWDGKGYPDGLKGDEISVCAQVVSIADVYDALLSPRIYKRAYTPDEAKQMIAQGQCGTFNPKLVACFLQAEPELRKLYQNTQPKAVPAEENDQSSKEMFDVLLMLSAVQAAFDLIVSVNLTRNSYHIVTDNHSITHAAGVSGEFDHFIAAGLLAVPSSHQARVKAALSREQLLQAYRQSEKSVTLRHPLCMHDGRIVDVDTSVLFMEDPRNADVRAIVLTRYHV